MIQRLVKSDLFSQVLAVTTVIAAAYCFYVDMHSPKEYFWFQRSGAILVLAGVELQYAKLIGLWDKSLQREMAIPSVEDRVRTGQGISMLQEAKQSVATREFAMRIHQTLTEKDPKDIFGLAFILLGTVIWAYGDLPFKH